MKSTIAAAILITAVVGTSANALPALNASHFTGASAGDAKLVDWDDWHNRWRSHYRWGSHREWGGGDWHDRWRSHHRWGSQGEWGGGDGWHNRWRSHYRWGSDHGEWR